VGTVLDDHPLRAVSFRLGLRKIREEEGMAAERLSVRKIREVLRLNALGLGRRDIGRSVNISHNTAGLYISRAQEVGLTPELMKRWTTRRCTPGSFRRHHASPTLGRYRIGPTCTASCAGRA
jgi:hypothetical protein